MFSNVFTKRNSKKGRAMLALYIEDIGFPLLLETEEEVKRYAEALAPPNCVVDNIIMGWAPVFCHTSLMEGTYKEYYNKKGIETRQSLGLKPYFEIKAYDVIYKEDEEALMREQEYFDEVRFQRFR